MKIAMLAPQKAGKTCYLTSLFSELGERSCQIKSEYPILFEFSNPKQQGDLEVWFENMLEGSLPDGTGERTSYQINLLHQIKRENINIELIDYPGGYTKKKGNNIDDIENTINELSTCDAFIILIDSTNVTANSNAKFKSYSAIKNISSILDSVIERKKGAKYSLHGVPFVFALSKFDKIGHDKELVEKGYQRIINSFPNFFSEEAECISMITGVSIGNNIDKQGEYEPLNITLPFEFCLSIGLHSGAKYHKPLKEKAEEEKDKASNYLRITKKWLSDSKHKAEKRRNMNMFDKIDNFFSSGYKFQSELDFKVDSDSYRVESQAEEHQEYLDKYYHHLSELESLKKFGSSILNAIDNDVFINNEALIIYKKRLYAISNNHEHSQGLPLRKINTNR